MQTRYLVVSVNRSAGKGVLVRGWLFAAPTLLWFWRLTSGFAIGKMSTPAVLLLCRELPVLAGLVEYYLLYLIICFCECWELENRNNNMFRGLILSHDPQGLFPLLIPKGELQVAEVEKVMRKDICEGLVWTWSSKLKTKIISTSHPHCPKQQTDLRSHVKTCFRHTSL